MVSTPRLPAAVAAIIAVAVLSPAESAAVSFNISSVALTGDPAPGTSGTFIAFDLDLPSVNETPTVVFAGFVTGAVSAGVFKYTDGVGTPVSLEGDAAPNSGAAATYTQFTPVHVNDSGLVAFRAGVKGGTTPVGIFPCLGARSDASDQALREAYKGGHTEVRSLRLDAHDPSDACWLHGEGLCLSRAELK